MANEIKTLDNDNYDAMAVLMGMDSPTASGTKRSMLTRLAIQHESIMGKVEVKGKMKNMEIVPAGVYRLDMDGDVKVYGEVVQFRPFIQKQMVQRYLSDDNRFVKTMMHNNLKGDLKDNNGGVNCGRPSGYIKDWNSVSTEVKTLIRECKRTNVWLGTVTLADAVFADGTDAGEYVEVPVAYEIKNNQAFKDSEAIFKDMFKRKLTPLQYIVTLTSEEVPLNNGKVFFQGKFAPNYKDVTDITDAHIQTLNDFNDWVVQHNEWISRVWSEKNLLTPTADDEALAADFYDVDGDDVEVTVDA